MENINQIKIIEDRLIADIAQKENAYIEEALTTKLKVLGFRFNDKQELYEFIKNRLHRISFSHDAYEIRLDYVDDKNTGEFVLRFETQTEFETKGTTVSANMNFKIT